MLRLLPHSSFSFNNTLKISLPGTSDPIFIARHLGLGFCQGSQWIYYGTPSAPSVNSRQNTSPLGVVYFSFKKERQSSAGSLASGSWFQLLLQRLDSFPNWQCSVSFTPKINTPVNPNCCGIVSCTIDTHWLKPNNKVNSWNPEHGDQQLSVEQSWVDVLICMGKDLLSSLTGPRKTLGFPCDLNRKASCPGNLKNHLCPQEADLERDLSCRIMPFLQL